MFKVISIIVLIFFAVNMVFTTPSRNQSSGCSGGSCHSHSPGIVTANILNETQVQVKLTGVSSGAKVAGELVDGNGSVVDVINSTSSNPFILTAPAAGKYRINAGYRRPSRVWDSTSVELGVTGLFGDNVENINLVKEFAVFPNYPNPFNAITVIKFFTAKEQSIEINIYNILGQKIETLYSGSLSAGMHTVRLNAENMNSGVYFYSVSNGGNHVVKKMMLTK